MERAKDVMAPLRVAVSPEKPVSEVASQMVENRVEALAVVDAEGKLLGAVWLRDIVARAAGPAYLLETLSEEDAYQVMAEFRSERERLAALTASQIMHAESPTVAPDAPLPEVAAAMAHAEFCPVFVVEQDRPIGLITPLDLCRALVEHAPGGQQPGESVP